MNGTFDLAVGIYITGLCSATALIVTVYLLGLGKSRF